MKICLLALAALILTLLAPTPALANESWEWPMDGQDVGRKFDLPDSPYGAGNRGVDLRGRIGAEVRSVASGRVSFVGTIAHVKVVVVDHGHERSTYQPVAASVRLGDAVAAGQSIGVLVGGGNHCPDTACLHLGRKVADNYLDPLALMTTSGQFRLISPDGPRPWPPEVGLRGFKRPVGGSITSPFGPRRHPVTGKLKLHDGTDFGVACGTKVRASVSGKVVRSGFWGAYGNTVSVDTGHGLVTSYSHLSSQSVSVGDRVSAGNLVGRSGNTGLSTGCHLHFMVRKGGKAVNPMG